MSVQQGYYRKKPAGLFQGRRFDGLLVLASQIFIQLLLILRLDFLHIVIGLFLKLGQTLVRLHKPHHDRIIKLHARIAELCHFIGYRARIEVEAR